MTLENVLTKVHEKLASDEIGLAMQKFDSEMGEFALTCLRQKRADNSAGSPQTGKLDSIKNILLSGLNSAKDKIKDTPGGANIASGLGGAALGGLFGNLSSSKGEFETDEDFNRRKRNSTLSGLVAGGAIGASVPSILNTLGGVTQNLVSGGGEQKKTLKDKAKDIINPTTILATGGAAGGGFLNNYLTKNNLAALPENVRKDGGDEFIKAVGAHPYFGGEKIDKLINSIDTKAIKEKMYKEMARASGVKITASEALKGGLKSSILRPLSKTTLSILRSALSRKGLLPIAGAAALPALNELYLGDKFFDQPAFQ